MESGSLSKNETIQGEIEIMQSAYGNEFEDLRNENSRILQKPPAVRLQLGPHHTQGGTLYSHVFANLKILTNYGYPDDPAEVLIESCEGITDTEKEKLRIELKSLCIKYSKLGMVVMMEISHLTQSFLSEHARPFAGSVYDEMMAGQKAKMEALQQAEAETQKIKEKEKERQRILIKEELEIIQGALKEEARARKERYNECISGNSEIIQTEKTKLPTKRLNSRSISECSEESSTAEIHLPNSINFTTSGKQEINIVIQESLGERPEQFCIVTLGREKVDQERFVVYSWVMRPKKIGKNQLKTGQDFMFEELLSKTSSIEKEMSSLLKLSHENLVLFKAMKVIHPQNDLLYIHILQDYVQGHCLTYYIDSKLPLNELFIQHVASGIIKALDYLHSNNVVHRNLRDSCVFLDHQFHNVRLADYGIERRCVETAMEFYGQEESVIYPLSPGRGGKKCDIFRFGILILSLYRGKRINQIAPSLPNKMSENLRNFLTHCLELSEQERWTSHQLTLHPFMLVSAGENGDSIKPEMALMKSALKEQMQERNDSLTGNFQLPPNMKGYSRFSIEYDFLEWLGKGGFGHVYKVRNRIDDRVYALKRIPLQHQTEYMRRKMTREVKLLSSLNHENVVRYYTSWIESLTQDQLEETRKCTVNGRSLNSGKDLSSFDIVEDGDASFIESESEEEDKDWLMLSLRLSNVKDESDNILFLNSSEDEAPQKDYENEFSSSTRHLTASQPKRFQYLFIQMQYCEKNTLRQAIDHHLYLDQDRVWQLFREITNGLDYIHSQGLIHRDLKPGNIFLDSSDNIKIGDFGLATVAFKDISTANDNNTVDSVSLDVKDSSVLTGHVGTTLYIAPELTKVVGKVSYNKKVDIYSLGIIFFEMVYPLSTGMERVKLLSLLRLSQPIFPEDFECSKKQKLILWLLNHNHLDRPSTGELLKSPLLPPPTAEEQKFMATLDSKVKNVRSKDYQDILNLLFKPCSRPELEATFEVYMHKLSPKQLLMYDFVKNQITSVFRNHGGIWIPTYFYIPRGSFYQEKENLVSLMSKGGELIAAQFELRYPFARYVAKSDLKHVRRYSIDRVQRAHKISGVHPTEIYECAFDIINAKYNLIESGARVIFVAQEILLKISGLYISEVTLKFCHSELIKLILTHSGVEENYHSRIINLLYDFRGRYIQLENFGTCLKAIGIKKNVRENLIAFLKIEGPVDDVISTLQSRLLTTNLRRRHLNASIKSVLAEVKEFKQTAIDIGIKFEVILRPLMVVDLSLYEGISFQLIPQSSCKKSTMNVLAQGGSYDHLITHLRNQNLTATKRTESNISAVGVSLPLERIVANLDLTKKFITSVSENRVKNNQGITGSEILQTEIFICTIEQRQLKERVDLINQFKVDGINVDHDFAMSKVEAEVLSEELWFIPYFVFLFPDKVILRSNDNFGLDHNARANERKINHHDLYEYLSKLIKSGKGSDLQTLSTISGRERKESYKPGSFKLEDFTPNIVYLVRKQTRSKDYTKFDAQITEEVASCIYSRWTNVSIGDLVEILVLDLNKKALLSLGELDVESTVKNFNDSVSDIKIRFPDSKDYIDRICKALLNIIFYRKKADRPAVIICYSITAECLKRIL